MTKKSRKIFIISVIAAAVALSFLGASQTGWFEEKMPASILSTVSSLSQKVGSSITKTIGKIIDFSKNFDGPAACTPPVAPKPFVQQNALGTMTIDPETQEATKDSIITISLDSHIEALSVQLGTDPLSPYRWATFAKGNIIDWGPKPAQLPTGEKGVSVAITKDSITWETHDYVGENNKIQKRGKLPAQTYWAKLKVDQTSPWEANKNTGSYGWKEVQYNIHYVQGAGLKQSDFKTVSGNSVYYVGGPQYPTGAIVRVGENIDSNLSDDLTPYYGKAVTVKAGEPFEIEAKPTGWQGGTFTMDTGATANVVGPSSITVKAGGSAVFKVLPRGTFPVRGSISIENRCNDVFASQFPTRYFDILAGKFEAPVKFDFKGVSKEKMRLTFRGGTFALDFNKPESALTVVPWISLMDDGVVVVNAPNQPILLEAVYKDNPSEIAKHIIISSAQATTGKEGTANFKVSAPNVTKEEVSRGILLKASAPDIAGLTSEVQLVFTGVTIEITQPKEKTEELVSLTTLPKSLVVSANKVASEFIEEETITFAAKFTMPDGSVQSAAGKVTWAVLGSIGTITPVGIFTAKLDDSIEEYGEGFGFVTATYADSAGNSLLGQSSLIKVKAKISASDDQGG